MTDEIINEKKPEVNKEKRKINWEAFHDKHYIKLMFIPIVILILALIYLAAFYFANGDIMHKDITLTGGTILTVNVNEKIDTNKMTSFLESKLAGKDVSIRTMKDIYSGNQIAISIESNADSDLIKKAVEEYGIKLEEGKYSIEVTGSTLSKSFGKELLIAVAIAFIFMAIVIFILFRVPIPSLAVIFAAFTDIIVTLAVIDLLGVKLGTAGIAAFLMLIGYSVDTDIMLTSRALKGKDSGLKLNTRLFSAIKTGFMMTWTSIAVTLIGYFVLVSPVLKQVFLILSIGLFVDLIATWLGNLSIIKWYCKKKKIN